MESVLRHITDLTTESFLLIGCLVLMTLARLTDEARFPMFINIFFSEKYFKLYGKEKNATLHWFNILLLLVQVITLGFLLKLSINYFQLPVNTNILTLTAFILLIILFKFYLEKTIANIFDINAMVESYHFEKLSFLNLNCLLCLPLITILTYNNLSNGFLLFSTISLFILLNVISFILILKNHQKIIRLNLFYFILYLCALEIAPFLILGKVLSGSI
ncbi:DUF4271 domain-containing protein [Zhouia spongiae]|uniref:DUF4271 domain-containing protein n=1 Tax=Zhouia spongiae TaxID=2202721 RepID=A0ABY3YU84_9FLAO|nr:DUF4271 domain-containing protein [Zhouia spongiae]UNZ00099.1 DUF4271 domain-containing protein [Zhouia spongiae]